MKYNKKFNEILDSFVDMEDEEYKSITLLAELYKRKNDRLHKIIKLSDKQQMAILKLNEELDSYKNHLEEKVQEEIQRRKFQEELLFERSRLASIAEMIDAVAHQWVQPLNIISMQLNSHPWKTKHNPKFRTLKALLSYNFNQ